MGINANQLREYIIRPSLKELNLWSEVAENLITGICAVESNMGLYLHQINGPALGIYQMEPETYNDIWNTVLQERKYLIEKLHYSNRTDPEVMIYDLKYATKMCRINFIRFGEPLPTSNSISDLAEYWKKYYNTKNGKGTKEDFVRKYLLTAN